VLFVWQGSASSKPAAVNTLRAMKPAQHTPPE
jgi:hypothetical protein